MMKLKLLLSFLLSECWFVAKVGLCGEGHQSKVKKEQIANARHDVRWQILAGILRLDGEKLWGMAWKRAAA